MHSQLSILRTFRAPLARIILLASALFALVAMPAHAETAIEQPQPPQPAPLYWTPLLEAAAPQPAGAGSLPVRYQMWQLNLPALNALLASAPTVELYPEVMAAARDASIVVALPLSSGEVVDFAVVDSPMMEAGLAASFPNFRTFAGYAIGNPATTVRMGVTTLGFHATIWAEDATTWIDSVDRGATDRYIVYAASDAVSAGAFDEATIARVQEEAPLLAAGDLSAAGDFTATGDELFTYRLAVSATGEYTAYFGGTVPNAMAAIVAAVNRLNGIFMRDLAIRFVLVANNSLLVHTNPLSDPFSNNNADALLVQNQASIDALIGSENYDIGHVFSTGAGGLASLGAVCSNEIKAEGATGSAAPDGDPFWVDFVAHEIGHQFNAEHTFNNNNASSCFENRNESTAWEPGSGSTILSYAGICAPQNLQANSDDYFHIGSIDQILAFTRLGNGYSCAAKTATGNTPPVANVPPSGFTIPHATPYTLLGEGTDADGTASLTYTWEQFDLGPAGNWGSPSGNAPIVRSIPPATTLASRTIPRISSLVANTSFQAESLPMYARSMRFRMSVRDNNPGGGGIDSAELAFNVTTDAGPFAVTYPDGALLLPWLAGWIHPVAWSVANTDLAPVNCANVEILLSTDGGLTYPTVLAASTPNDGAADVLVPNVATTQARVMVKCRSSIFFDISNANFEIVNTSALKLETVPTPSSGNQVQPGDAIVYSYELANDGLLPLVVALSSEFDTHLVNADCDGALGNLALEVALAAVSLVSINCTTEVDPTLALQVSHSASQTIVPKGAEVTFTIVVTNPTGIALEGVSVSTNHGVVCSPALETPFTLQAQSAQTFVCPGVVINSDMDFQATARSEITLQNRASAVAVALAPGTLNSNLVSHVVVLEATQEASVALATGLGISATVLPRGLLDPGDILTYTLLVGNSSVVALETTTTNTFSAPLVNPVCNGVAGNLAVNKSIAANSSVSFVCTAQIDPTLAVEVAVGTEESATAAGGAPVTYTIAVTNPNTLPLTQVTVSAPLLGDGCDSNPATPRTLAPLASLQFTCTVTGVDTSVTVTVSAQLAFANVAQVASTEVDGSPFVTSPLQSIVRLSGSSTNTPSVPTQLRNYLTPVSR